MEFLTGFFTLIRQHPLEAIFLWIGLIPLVASLGGRRA